MWLSRFEACVAECTENNRQSIRKFFPTAGCVIMASGLSKRFGSNKLLAEFDGQPMILKALQASETFGEHRVVVTHHKDVATLCEEMDVDTPETLRMLQKKPIC